MTHYQIKRTGKREYSHCEKHTFQVIENESGETVAEDTLSFSNWQLDDEKYEERVKNWASTVLGSEDHRFDVSTL